MREFVLVEDGKLVDDSDLVAEPERRFGARLGEARRSRQMTQVMLSAGSGKSASLVAAVEAGRRRATDDFLVAVGQVLGLEARTLISTRDLLEYEARRAKFGSDEDPDPAKHGQSLDGVATQAQAHDDAVDRPVRERALRALLIQKSQRLTEGQLQRLLGYIDGLSEDS